MLDRLDVDLLGVWALGRDEGGGDSEKRKDGELHVDDDERKRMKERER
jgi:hypothetical protein